MSLRTLKAMETSRHVASNFEGDGNEQACRFGGDGRVYFILHTACHNKLAAVDHLQLVTISVVLHQIPLAARLAARLEVQAALCGLFPEAR